MHKWRQSIAGVVPGACHQSVVHPSAHLLAAASLMHVNFRPLVTAYFLMFVGQNLLASIC